METPIPTVRKGAPRCGSLQIPITDRLKSSLYLRAAVAEQGADVAVAAVGQGEAADTALGAFKAFGHKLETAIDLAVARDRTLHDLRSEEATLRRERDDMKRHLGRQVVGLRRIVRGAYVAPDLTALGLDAPNPKEPTAFLRKAELIYEKLGGEGRSRMLGKPLFHSAEDPRIYREELKPSLRALRETLDQLAKVRRRIDAMLVKKHEAVEEYDRVFLRTARMFEDLCRLGGYDALAERVRPSSRNPGRTEQKADVADEVVAESLVGRRGESTDSSVESGPDGENDEAMAQPAEEDLTERSHGPDAALKSLAEQRHGVAAITSAITGDVIFADHSSFCGAQLLHLQNSTSKTIIPL